MVLLAFVAGLLTPAGTFATGGSGLATLGGRHGAVELSGDSRYLYAINAGSGTVSVFRVGRDRTSLLDVVSSHGDAPASVAEHDGRVYVLNSGGVPSVTAFSRSHGGSLRSRTGWRRFRSTATASPARLS